MYCSNCGAKFNEEENYCANCGKLINEHKPITIGNNNEGARSASIVLGILSLVGIFIFIFAPISLILSIIGLILAIKSSKTYKNTAGIVINAISLFLSCIITAIIALIIMFSYNIIKNDFGNIGNYIERYQIVNSDKF